MRRRRRSVEALLLGLVALVVLGAYVLASLGRTASIPADIGPFLGAVFGLFVVGHVAIRRLAPEADGLLLPLAALLNGVGYVFVARMNGDLARLHALWTAVGMAGFIGTLVIVRRVRTLERYRYSFAALGIVLLVLPALPGIGREINGARIWISLGPLNFQPGEAAKLTLAAFLAAYLVEKRELLSVSTRRIGPLSLPDPQHLAPLLGAWGVSVLIMVRQKDLGSSLLFFALFVVLLWIATDRAAYLMIGTVLFGAGAFVAHRLFGHVQARFRIWIDPWSEAKGAGYQLVEAAFAMADGGLVGTGLGRGDSARIPARETDFIFAVIAEELGLLGATAVLAAFVLLVGTVLRIALRAEVPFEKMLATALGTLLGVQSVLIIGGVVRVLPLTGVTLPFVSYGGSSLLANYVLLALVVRISDDSGRRALRRAAEAEAAGSSAAVGS